LGILEIFLFFFLSTLPVPDGLGAPWQRRSTSGDKRDFALGTLKSFLFSFSLYKHWTEGFRKPEADRKRIGIGAEKK